MRVGHPRGLPCPGEKPKGPGTPTEQVGAGAGEGNDIFDLIFILPLVRAGRYK